MKPGTLETAGAIPVDGSESCVAVFDLDGTLTWRDTLAPYLAGYARRHPVRLLHLWRLPMALLAYAVHRDRGVLKAALIRMVMGGEARALVDRWSDAFVAGLARRGTFRPAALAALAAHHAAGHHLVLLSASPDLYVPRIGRLLGMEHTICTEVRWLTRASGEEDLEGGLITPNRHGEEKSCCLARLRSLYGDLPLTAYGNSGSDLPHLAQADRGWLVNGNSSARRAAAAAGIAAADWTF